MTCQTHRKIILISHKKQNSTEQYSFWVRWSYFLFTASSCIPNWSAHSSFSFINQEVGNFMFLVWISSGEDINQTFHFWNSRRLLGQVSFSRSLLSQSSKFYIICSHLGTDQVALGAIWLKCWIRVWIVTDLLKISG